MEIYELVRDKLLKTIRENAPVHGILLALHGAQILEETEDGEGDLLSEIRDCVGPDVPIVISLDLHANITKKMMQNADAAFGYDYYPHTDKWNAGYDAARCLIQTLKKEVKPVMRYKKIPFLCPYLQTDLPLLKALVDKEHDLEKLDSVLGVNIYYGFISSDIREAGVAVVAITDDDAALAQKIADSLASEIWDLRSELKKEFYTVDEAVAFANGTNDYPIVFADVTDNPGAGGTGDGTNLLRRMIELGVQDAAVAAICDPATVKLAEKVGIDAEIEVDLGGKLCPEGAGRPIHTKAVVRTLTNVAYIDHSGTNQGLLKDHGRGAVLRIGGIDVIVCSANIQPLAYDVFECVGINPRFKKILVVKSTIHYRAAFSRLTKHLLDVEVPGICPQHPSGVPYQKVQRPIYPLDEI